MGKDSGTIENARDLAPAKQLLLGFQHLFTMFGSSVLVPLTTGLDISVVLFMNGLGTLLFHFMTKKKVPVFLGSSYAYITPVITVAAMYAADGLAYARGGILIAGVVYMLMSLVVWKFGTDRISKLFPPVITGSMILVIGLNLAPTAISMASENWAIGIVGLLIVIICNIYGKGFIKVVPVLLALCAGYLVSLAAGNVDLTPIREAAWIGIPAFATPKFSITAICMVTPVCIATMVEHFGDVAAIGGVVQKDFYQDPGVNRTLFADGLATFASTLGGGCALTTYSENTGVLALTKVFDPFVMRLAAGFAIVLSFCPKLAALLRTVPSPLIGGVSIILFGLVAGTGLRTLHKVNFSNSRNQILFAIIAILSLGNAALSFYIGNVNVAIAGMPLSAIIAIIINQILPKTGDEYFEEQEENA
nr:solute carrier family 23 protein [uncultured Schaedlerella sp.]